MFSKRMVLIIGMIIFITANIIALSMLSRRSPSIGISRFAIYVIAPFQKGSTNLILFVKDLWYQYFYLVSAAGENEKLKIQLAYAFKKNNRCNELELSNDRFRKLLDFRQTIAGQVVAAEVIGRDPTVWIKTIIIDKGSKDGVEKLLPVVAPEGIVGQITEVSLNSSKVLLIIDQNSAVDGLIQRTRARGIVKGKSYGQCLFKYVLRKHDVNVNDVVVSTGLDGVFPKGLSIGYVSGIVKRVSGIFQEMTVTPYVDFERLEEVLVLLEPQVQDTSDNKIKNSIKIKKYP